mmetsp:Transcript_31941/g.28952  ORF Transcript_31941/g.28952 Transcript_31941/m.28952 type:complete len:132 (-) Transcript_31941:181-576(-)
MTCMNDLRESVDDFKAFKNFFKEAGSTIQEFYFDFLKLKQNFLQELYTYMTISELTNLRVLSLISDTPLNMVYILKIMKRTLKRPLNEFKLRSPELIIDGFHQDEEAQSMLESVQTLRIDPITKESAKLDV